MSAFAASSVPPRVKSERTRLAWPARAALAMAAWTLLSPLGGAPAGPIHGLPPIRAYSLEDIGYVAKGARLDFDPFGRLAVIHEGVYVVLNDTSWINLADDEDVRSHVMTNLTQAADGRMYFGARETWGYIEASREGRWRTVSLAPDDAPEWTRVAIFEDILATSEGVFFASWNGVVYWDFKERRSRYFPHRGVSCIFSVGDRAFLGSLEHPISHIDVAGGTLRPVDTSGDDGVVIEYAAPMGADRTMLAEADGRTWLFDGRTLSPWMAQGAESLGPISVLKGLVDGGVAVGVLGRGLFIYDADGRLRLGLDLPAYHRINDIANREPGVLWVATEETVERILYGSPLRTFGQRLGLTASWPVVARWQDRVFAISEGKLYEVVADDDGLTSRFEPAAVQPPGGAWSMVARGDRLLVSSGMGVFAMRSDRSFDPVMHMDSLPTLALVGEDTCFAIGASQISAMRWQDGRWTEVASRRPGLSYTPVVHGTAHSAWVEMGGGGVARVWLSEGAVHTMTVENESWTATNWVNVGVIDDLVVLSASRGSRRFFSESTGEWCDAPAIRQLLDRPRQWIVRSKKDGHGVIWASHNEGVVAFTPTDGGYDMDAVSFDQINDRYPMIHILGDDDIWISAARSLHRVEPRAGISRWSPANPIVVSIFDAHTNEELLPGLAAPRKKLSVPFAHEGLLFRFFAGGYGWRRVPVYEYRLDERDAWTRVGSGSLLGFNGLREGNYLLQARFADHQSGVAAVTSVPFEIRPPWHRTGVAYAGFSLGILAVVTGTLRWSGHVTRKRNRLLEAVVHDRTKQLEEAMEKLNEETRNAATLAERNRLAGEIHDSLQQGLSGAILQLDTTLTLSSVPGDIRSRLNVIRNMVSYARQEVQHAVWDMESPLAEGVELGEALRRLAGYINPGSATLDMVVEGEPFPVHRSTKHHLLRVAQEAATNAARHASATRIRICLLYERDVVTVSVSDDGVGFDPQDAMKANIGHFGLRGIRSRARKLNGVLSIETTPGGGATIRITVPRTADGDLSP